MEPSHIQKIAAGKVDVALTTSIAIAAAFELDYSELASIYEKVTEKDIQEFLEKSETQKKHKGISKLPLSKQTVKNGKKK